MVIPDGGRACDADRRSLFTPPRELTLTTALLILGAVPWFFVYLDNTVAGSSAVSATGGDLASGTSGAMLLLNIVYVVLAVRVRLGRRATRTKVLILTVAFDLMLLTMLTGLGNIGTGWSGEAAFVVGISLFTVVMSIIGLLLLFSGPARNYVAESEAGILARLDRAEGKRETP